MLYNLNNLNLKPTLPHYDSSLIKREGEIKIQDSKNTQKSHSWFSSPLYLSEKMDISKLPASIKQVERIAFWSGRLASKTFSYLFKEQVPKHVPLLKKEFLKNKSEYFISKTGGSGYSLVGHSIYNKGFGVHYKWNQRPHFKYLGSQEIDNIFITAVNGIGNSPQDLTNLSKHLETLFEGKTVKLLCNPTLGLVRDVYRYAQETFGKKITPASIQLAHEWVHQLSDSPQQHIIHIAHSEGVAITRNALLLMDPELRKRIHVIAVAPGCSIDKELCADVIHLVSVTDPIPHLDAQGLNKAIENKKVVLLFPNCLKMDHAINGETYNTTIKKLVDEKIANIKKKLSPENLLIQPNSLVSE